MNLGKCRLRFFFFQAEDGIRDAAVTGVQTCALPIYPVGWTFAGTGPAPESDALEHTPKGGPRLAARAASSCAAAAKVTRSEEHTSELQSRLHLVCRLLLEKKKRTCVPCICIWIPRARP